MSQEERGVVMHSLKSLGATETEVWEQPPDVRVLQRLPEGRAELLNSGFQTVGHDLQVRKSFS